jgi:toxin ParE1/3/4
MTVEYHSAIQRELEEIRDWYNNRVPGLGTQFIDEFDRHALKIAASPRRWMVIQGEIRRAIMPRFPYIIYFRQIGTNHVRITVVKHQRRHPSFGRERM